MAKLESPRGLQTSKTEQNFDSALADTILKDHAKISHIMKKRIESLKHLQQVWNKGDLDHFVSSITQQRDMFVVCDILNMVTQTDINDLAPDGELDILDSVDAALKNEENKPFLESISFSQSIMLLKKLIQPRFMIDSKYKIHRVCAVNVMLKRLERWAPGLIV